MRQPPKHTPERPTTCDMSDLLNEMFQFTQENPMWAETEDGLGKMSIAYAILNQISTPLMASEEEIDFVMSIYTTIQERNTK